MPRVFISDNLESSGLDLLQQAGMELDNRQEQARKQGYAREAARCPTWCDKHARN